MKRMQELPQLASGKLTASFAPQWIAQIISLFQPLVPSNYSSHAHHLHKLPCCTFDTGNRYTVYKRVQWWLPFSKCVHNKSCQLHLFYIFMCHYLIIPFIRMFNKLCSFSCHNLWHHKSEYRVWHRPLVILIVEVLVPPKCCLTFRYLLSVVYTEFHVFCQKEGGE